MIPGQHDHSTVLRDFLDGREATCALHLDSDSTRARVFN